MLSDLRMRVRALFRREDMEAELEDELRFHFDNEIEKHIRAGVTSEEAERLARLRFGGFQQVREECRNARGTSSIAIMLNDIRYGMRIYRKSPGYFAVTVLTLALGIGAGISVFSLVNAVLLQRSPYPNADRLVVPWRGGEINRLWSSNMPWGNSEFMQLAETNKVFENLGAFRKDDFNLTGIASPEHIEGIRASAGLFPALGMEPELGRTFTLDEDKPGSRLVVLLSHSLWMTRFGGDNNVVGSVIRLNGLSYTVIGVMPAAFTFPDFAGLPASIDLPRKTDLWVPLALAATPPLGGSDLTVVAKMKDKVTLDDALRDMKAVDRGVIETRPQLKGWSTQLVPFRQQTVGDTKEPLLLLLGTVLVVLLIACCNVAGLMLNRSLRRSKEFILRGALGARKSRLFGQLLIESMLVALPGGALGLLVAAASLSFTRRFGPASIPHLDEAGLDWRVTAFALGVTLLTGILSGVIPGIAATRLNPMEGLKEGGQRSIGSASAPRLRSLLLIAQIAMALVLVVSAGLLIRTFSQLIVSDSGFNASRVVTFTLPLPAPKYTDTDRMAMVYRQVAWKLYAIPGVQSVGFATVVPLAGPSDATVIRIPAHPAADPSQRPVANYLFVSPGYFGTIGASFQRGRDIAESDTLRSMPVAIVNATMAKKCWPGEDPIGQKVGVGATKIPARTVIGVVADTKQVSLSEAPAPTMYVPYSQNEIKVWPSMQAMQYVIRVNTGAASIDRSIQEAVHAVDPDLPVANFTTLNTLLDQSLNGTRFAALLLTAFGAFVLVLAAIGLYGVVSCSVSQRTLEIGVRIALGAKRAHIFAMVLAQSAQPVCLGIAAGLVGAFASTRMMSRFLYGVRPTDPFTFAAASLLLIAVSFLAGFWPARRAMSVDPMVALRSGSDNG